MKVELKFSLKNENLTLDFRASILSFIKKALHQKYNDYYNQLYKDVNSKGFTFCADLRKIKIVDKKYLVNEKIMKIKFSFLDRKVGLIFYSAFHGMRNVSYPLPLDNSMILTSINVIDSKRIISDRILVEFSSPLIVRDHNKETNKDDYLIYSDVNFNTKLNVVLKKFCDDNEILYTPVLINPISCKDTVAVSLGRKIRCNYGLYELVGDIEILNICYLAGLGSKRSQGFGSFEIIKQILEVS